MAVLKCSCEFRSEPMQECAYVRYPGQPVLRVGLAAGPHPHGNSGPQNGKGRLVYLVVTQVHGEPSAAQQSQLLFHSRAFVFQCPRQNFPNILPALDAIVPQIRFDDALDNRADANRFSFHGICVMNRERIFFVLDPYTRHIRERALHARQETCQITTSLLGERGSSSFPSVETQITDARNVDSGSDVSLSAPADHADTETGAARQRG